MISKHTSYLWMLVLVALVGMTLACATLRSPEDPAPTRLPTDTFSATPIPIESTETQPFRFGG